MMKDKTSRVPGFYNLNVEDRVKFLKEFARLTEEEVNLLGSGGLLVKKANRMIENVVGVYALPLGIATNFLINGRDYVIPMVIEEPSVVAALSFAAKLAREGGGFTSIYSGSITTGQIQLVGVSDPFNAKVKILEHKDEIIKIANEKDPVLLSFGGGVTDLRVRVFEHTKIGHMVIIYLYIDTKDAMGANTVNTMCEGVTSFIEKITGGKVYLRILSNLSDKRLVRTRCKVPKESLKFDGFSGEDVVNGILVAHAFAEVDPYRAATHNKGIMNGIDPVLIATGNDWRAEEAAAHAYAARSGHYSPLTVWEKDSNGDLIGTIELPVLAGIVGGATKVHPLAQVSLKVMGIRTVKELAEILGAVGLGQNLTALRALSTEGLQKGHMRLHARNIVATAGIPDKYVDEVAKLMIKSGVIRIDKAKEIYRELRGKGKLP